jgi:hypothetical protein
MATIQDHIDYNRKAIDRGARLVMHSMCAAGASAVLAVILLASTALVFHHAEKAPALACATAPVPVAAPVAPAAVGAGPAPADVHRP